jgi:hypothetical protein
LMLEFGVVKTSSIIRILFFLIISLLFS